VCFDAGYATAAMCSSSRAALLTGRYQNRFGFEYNAGWDERVEAEGLGLDTGERTIAEHLRAAGLHTPVSSASGTRARSRSSSRPHAASTSSSGSSPARPIASNPTCRA
jgi:hypothetical protein